MSSLRFFCLEKVLIDEEGTVNISSGKKGNFLPGEALNFFKEYLVMKMVTINHRELIF